MAVPVLTYHSMRIGSADYRENDHVALREDLRLVEALGWKILPVSRLAALQRAGRLEREQKTVALSFDDAPDWDWHDMDHPEQGMQRGFAGILADFRGETGRVDVHATSFVIAGPDARRELDRTCMLGKGWWNDDWWRIAWTAGISIGNHSWDHNHATLDTTAQRNGIKGDFSVIDTYEECDIEVRQAADYVDLVLGRPACKLFAYPQGECSAYLAEFYLPVHAARHRQVAAFTSAGEPVRDSCSPWRLPRFICGDHWKSPEGLEAILRDSQAGIRT